MKEKRQNSKMKSEVVYKYTMACTCIKYDDKWQIVEWACHCSSNIRIGQMVNKKNSFRVMDFEILKWIKRNSETRYTKPVLLT
jgi:hypothetical protein